MQYPRKEKVYQNHHIDSERWVAFEPRATDVCIASTMKTGTTWTQALVANLLFPNQKFPKKVSKLSPWIDDRSIPITSVLQEINTQSHRRFIKTHLPLYSLRFFPEIKYIYVGRDGRDVALSIWNHYLNYTDEVYKNINNLPNLVGNKFPKPPRRFKIFWRHWCTKGWFDWENDGYPFWSHLSGVQSWWDYRDLPNILFLHYADMKTDLFSCIKKVASFLEIKITSDEITNVQNSISFEAMRANADSYVPDGGISWKGGSKTFLNKGINGRWRDLLAEKELQLYEVATKKSLSFDCRYWLENGGEVPD